MDRVYVVLDSTTPQVFTYDADGNLLGFVSTPLTSLLYSHCSQFEQPNAFRQD